MARTPSYDPAELERELGPRGGLLVNSDNRARAQNWLVAQGFPAAWVKTLRIATLAKAYNRPGMLEFFRKLQAEGKLERYAVEEAPGALADSADAAVLTVHKTTPSEPRPIPPLGEASGELFGRAESAPIAPVASAVLPASPANDAASIAKLQAAEAALRAAAALAASHEAILSRLNALDGKGGTDSAAAVVSHGDGSLPGTRMVAARDLFGEAASDGLLVPQYIERTQYVPEIDAAYCFDAATTRAILLGFCHNRRVLISGRHGTGKTSHVEQIAARLNWPCFRLNLDGHISRTDLIGRDSIVIEDGKQITSFREGILPWAMQQPMALVFDEYDAGRPDVLFVIQRLLETGGRLTIAETNAVIEPHMGFRLFGTANTVGLGDASGLYHGTNPLNAAQMDRWQVVARLDYMAVSQEVAVVCGKCPSLDRKVATRMVRVATSTRALFAANKISTLMSPRTVITWAQNAADIGDDHRLAFELSFLNKCDDSEMDHVRTCYATEFEATR